MSTLPRAGEVRSELVLGVGTAALLVSCVATPSIAESGPVLCPFRVTTGLPCPACGSMRAWVALAHGDVGGAMAHNPFASGLFALTVVLLARQLVARARGAARPRDIERLLASRFVWVAIAVWATWGVARMLQA